MNSTVARRRTVKPSILNPYIVVADVALSLLMIMITYFVITSDLTDALYAAAAQPIIRQTTIPVRETDYDCVPNRIGDEIHYKFHNSALFTRERVTLDGSQAMTAIAAAIQDPRSFPVVKDVLLTVSQSASIDPTVAKVQALALTHALKSHHLQCTVVTAARSISYAAEKDQDLARTEIVIELQLQSNRP